jgi:hypothetical protein
LAGLGTGAQLTWTLTGDGEDEKEDVSMTITALPPLSSARKTVTISVTLCPAWSVP